MHKLLLVLAGTAVTAASFAQGWTGDATTVSAGGSYSFKQGLIRAKVRSNLPAPTDVFITPNPFAPTTPATVAGSVFTIGKMDIVNPFSEFDIYYRDAALPAGAVEADLKVYMWNGTKWIAKGSTTSTGDNFVRTLSLTQGTYCIMAANHATFNSSDMLIYTAHKPSTTVGSLNALTSPSGWFKVETGTPGTSRVTSLNLPYEVPYLCSIDATCSRTYFWRKQPSGFYELYSANIDTSFPTRITNFGNVTDFGFVATSPNGQKVAFCAKVNGGWNAYLMESNGTSLFTLKTNIVPALLNAPTPAMQGSRVAVCGTNTLYMFNATTGVQEVAVSAPGNPFLGGIAFNSTGYGFALTASNGLYTGVTSSGALTLRHTATYPSDIPPAYSFANANYIAAPYQDGVDTLQLSPKVWTENVFLYGSSGNTPRMMIYWR